MKKIYILSILIISLISLWAGSNYYYLSPFYKKNLRAIAVIYPTKNNTVSGIVTFEEVKDGLHIHADLTSLKPGTHGFHIHEFGDCNCADATCAGDHFNPNNAHHGAPDTSNSHLGDLGNIIADKNGRASYDAINKRISLNGPNSIIGRSLIIHENKDDLKSQPTGNAGARIGCGVIGIQKKSL